MQGAPTVEEAVGQYYDNPDKYSHSSVSTVPDGEIQAKETRPQASPPPYAPPATTARTSQFRPHTNALIEAGNIRARDEVRFSSCVALHMPLFLVAFLKPVSQPGAAS